MDGVKEALLDPNVVIAWITAVLGPIAATLVTWATTRRRAEKAARKGAPTDDRSSVTQEVTAWARELRKDVSGLREEVHKLRELVYDLEDENDKLAKRVTDLERENATLVRHNKLLTKQVADLGGVPHPRPE